MRAPLPAIPPADKQSVGCPDSSVDSSILEWTENAHNATSVGGRGSNKADTASLKSEKISPGSPVIVIKRDKTTSVEFNRNAAASRRPLKKTLKHTEPQPASKSNIGDDQAPSVSADASERKDLDSNKSNSRDLDSGSAKTEELVARVPTRSKDPVSNICRSKDPVSNTLGSKGPVSTISRSNKARVVSDGEKKGRVRGWVNRMVRNKAPATAEVVVRQGLQRNRSVVSRKQGTPVCTFVKMCAI
ncbi:hypothetical protein SARC_05983 [Sphaeroforma arctica JP610]|uniref:Uncharacterized protein n=1 Tax=Sphaeroforma arctica JP610 TaxID=667725 RepID=A0A0L0FYS8_9EUKA|nr:hypothetical protein SARC_05983 [Sphaeroforma arctica JP610]KNC81711.1 hypothetical protein SARC_05983 [Sphaeroforma arctica JP610]|eukprot:XP_014155613.1 hypothetical protein SARC_05983 [Sphaeroforma arctica JP610]